MSKDSKIEDAIAELICDNIAADNAEYSDWEFCTEEGRDEWRELARRVIETYKKHAE